MHYKHKIPTQCPICGSEKEWNEVVDPFVIGIPLGKWGKFGRIRLFQIHSQGIKQNTYLTCQCQKCGHEETFLYDEYF